MPSKGMSILKESRIEPSDILNQQKPRNWSLLLIYTIILVFSLDVIGESIIEIFNFYQIDYTEANLCLARFVNDKCQLSSLSDQCKQLLKCLRGQDKSHSAIQIIDKVSDIFVAEIKENIPLPLILIFILAISKYLSENDRKRQL